MARDQAEPYGPVGRSQWMDVDWQRHLRWVRVQDRWMNIVDMGPIDSTAASAEEPLIFIHGLSGCWQNWLEQIPHFARDRRVIAVDLPGFGQSEMPAEEISISGYADAIDALMGELGVDTAQIVGNSMGGFIGAELAIQHPARVERLVLVAAAGLSIESIRTERTTGLRHRAENIAFFTLGNIASRSHQVALRPRLRHALLLLVAAHPAKLPGPLAAQQVLGSGKPGFSDALEAMCRYPLRDRLEKISCPTLIIWGDKDRLVPLKDASIFERLISDSRKIVYEDTGHVTMMERPARFNRDVRAFLEEAPGERQPAAQADAVAG
ncbi:MAG TPA: alpha/beta fold hydrolase [Solirubrobacteraceae bacterium]|nr:alpha/beta fold hydrolase [Solirubrobacteraceae bacterium]